MRPREGTGLGRRWVEPDTRWLDPTTCGLGSGGLREKNVRGGKTRHESEPEGGRQSSAPLAGAFQAPLRRVSCYALERWRGGRVV